MRRFCLEDLVNIGSHHSSTYTVVPSGSQISHISRASSLINSVSRGEKSIDSSFLHFTFFYKQTQQVMASFLTRMTGFPFGSRKWNPDEGIPDLNGRIAIVTGGSFTCSFLQENDRARLA